MTTVINGSSPSITFSDGTTQTTAGIVFVAGTALLFQQTSAPTGWTKVTTNDNAALRVVSGTVTTGGTVNFTTAFASQAVSGTVGSTTITTSTMPSHSHSVSDPGHRHGALSVNAAGGVDNPNWTVSGASIQQGNAFADTSKLQTGVTVGSNGSDGSHNHSFTGTAINLAVKYVDTIIATKN